MKKLDHYRSLVTDRQQWNSTFEEVGKYCWPNARTIVKSVQHPDKGQITTIDISDSTAIKAAVRATSGVISFVMPVGTKWFDFRPRKEAQLKDRNILRKTSHATEVVQASILRSNFIREMFTTVRSLFVFGTGCISVEMIDGDLVYRNYHIADIFFSENSKGQIDTVYRRMYYTSRQMEQEFGDKVPETVKQAIKAGDFLKKFEVVHGVYPRKDRDSSKIDAKGKKFVSEYIEASSEMTMKEGGFNSVPYLIGRFERSPDELMGRGPGIDMLPDIRMLNHIRHTFIESSEKASNPPLIIEDDGVVGQPGMGPNDLIVVRAGAMEPHALQTGANPQLTYQVIEMERQGIMEGFYVDLFNALAQHQNMTATEVVNRMEEKMVMLAPTIVGMQKELLDPLISRTLKLIEGSEELKDGIGVDVDIAYQGRLALAMSNMQTNAIELWAAKWSPYQEMFPVLDNVDLDEGAAVSALNMGVPAKLIRTKDEVAEIRQPQQEAQQMEQMVGVAETGSKAIKNIQGTPLEGMI